ncbi:hypothetical protein [Streptomyces auratus]|nr:hypothetical protein [Streptomyces auratus]
MGVFSGCGWIRLPQDLLDAQLELHQVNAELGALYEGEAGERDA